MSTPSDTKADFPVVIELPVQWGDQDALGHVNNVIYFRWFESARIAYCEQVGLPELAEQSAIGPILASAACDFRRQITYPDCVHVGARIARIGRTSMTMEYQVVSERRQEVAAVGTSTLVLFDYREQKPVPVPPAMRSAIEKLEGRSFEAPASQET